MQFKANILTLLLITGFCHSLLAQHVLYTGVVYDCTDEKPAPDVTITIPQLNVQAKTNNEGMYIFNNLPCGNYKLRISHIGYKPVDTVINIAAQKSIQDTVLLVQEADRLNEVVVSGTMKAVSRLNSPIPVEVYSSKFFKSNPVCSLFDAMQNVNGVRPQINCNVCGTGDIKINGLDGPYTMILIDGMPIVSGLATVYGLQGIPAAIVERVEVVKGPASTLYGSEALGGVINVIPKKPGTAPAVSAELMGSSWKEINTEAATAFTVGKNTQALLAGSYFNYNTVYDNNGDGFTDMPLQKRLAVFNKWSIGRPANRIFNLAARYIYEDRWGGQTNWEHKYRGGDDVYGESVYTSRWELYGTYQLPVNAPLTLSVSTNGHVQNSAYGNTLYNASQYIGYAQLTWTKNIKRHSLLAGAATRYTWYDDNTPITAEEDNVEINKPDIVTLPGIFIQDSYEINKTNTLLAGLRYDYNSTHGSILTPRLSWMWKPGSGANTLRVGLGKGYRVVNVFTEDHAALTGARKVKFAAALKPEKSWNANIDFTNSFSLPGGAAGTVNAGAFYTRFSNKIIADVESDVNKVIYDNLNGYAISKGIAANVNINFPGGLGVIAGATLMDIYSMENAVKSRQLFSERFTATWTISYNFGKSGWTADYTGNLYSPMRLPLISEYDPRSETSPWWSVQNVQLTKKLKGGAEIFGGVKNILNMLPYKYTPFLIARAHDPFNKNVVYGADNMPVVTPENPYGLSFDPSYVFAPNQGIRAFLGIRYALGRANK